MNFEFPESIKIKKSPKAGFFGITSYAKSVTTLGVELSKNGYKTGLTSEEEKEFEKELDLKPGELNRHSKWWGNIFDVQHAIRLNNTKSTELILDNPINKIRYKVLLASSKIASSEIEKNKPGIEFYIDDQESKAKAELETFNYEFEGMGMIHKMSPDEKRDNLRLFGEKGLDTMTEIMLNSKLASKCKQDPKNFVETLNDKNVRTKAFILELIEKGLLKRKGNYYVHGDDTIANSTEECVEYFNDIKNQSVKLTLQSRLNKINKCK